MNRKLLIVLLSLGTIGGYTAGFVRLHHYRHGYGQQGCGWHGERKARFEDRVADVCVRAAERTLREKPAQ